MCLYTVEIKLRRTIRWKENYIMTKRQAGTASVIRIAMENFRTMEESTAEKGSRYF